MGDAKELPSQMAMVMGMVKAFVEKQTIQMDEEQLNSILATVVARIRSWMNDTVADEFISAATAAINDGGPGPQAWGTRDDYRRDQNGQVNAGGATDSTVSTGLPEGTGSDTGQQAQVQGREGTGWPPNPSDW